MKITSSFLFGILLLWSTAQSYAIYILGDHKDEINSSPLIENGGEKFEGNFYPTRNGQIVGPLKGTVVSRKHFATITHNGGKPGDRFKFHGMFYHVVTNYVDGNITLWEISERFPSSRIASLYTGRDEEGKGICVSGNGPRKGRLVTTALYVSSQPEPILFTNGWVAGEWFGETSSGMNTIELVSDNWFATYFNQTGGYYECSAGPYDSGGGAFIKVKITKNKLVWQLAGLVLSGEEGPYRLQSGEVVYGPMIDKSGLTAVYWNGTEWVDYHKYPVDGVVKPTVTVYERISSHLAFFKRVIGKDWK